MIKPKTVVIIGVIAVSFSAVFVRLSTAPAPTIAFWRLLIATVFTAALAIKSRHDFRRPQGNELLQTGLAGLFLALHFWTWFESLKLTTVASSTVLVATQPLFVILTTRLIWGERLSAGAIRGLIIALVGTLLIAMSGRTGLGQFAGNLLAVLAAIFAAAYFLVGSRARRTMEVNTYTFWTYLVCTLVLGLLVGLGPFPFRPEAPIDWFTFAALGIICHIGGHTSLNWALGYVSPSLVSTAILGEPVGATLWAWLLFSEIPTLGELAGGILVIVGLFIFLSHPTPSTGRMISRK